jgi:RNA polymerase sigma-70 factor (ECF subfamily)
VKAAEEAELVRGLVLGRPEAFEALAARYERPLLSFIGAYVADPAAADDVFQETLVRVVRSISEYRPQAGLGSWIFTIARNQALDHLRRRRRRREVPLGNVIPMTQPPPEADSARTERFDQVRAALQELPPPKREAVALRFFSNLGYEEMSDLLGAPVGTLKFRVHEALRELALLLKRRFGEDAHELSGSA